MSDLFCLRTVASLEAVDALIVAFDNEPKSDLLRHEICYCLGQMNESPEHADKIQAFFMRVMTEPHPKIVLHEAVEAYGNLSAENTL